MTFLEMPKADSIHLYAELLLNIKSVTLIANIDSASTEDTQAILVTNGSTLSLTHLDQEAVIRLPVKTIGNASATLTLPANLPKQLSSRLEVDGGNVADLLTLQEETQNHVPWSATDFSESHFICCCFCSQTVVVAGAVSEWRNTPSEDWAELSDFWLCHGSQKDFRLSTTSTRPFNESHLLTTINDIAFIDSSSFFLSPNSCCPLEV